MLQFKDLKDLRAYLIFMLRAFDNSVVAVCLIWCLELTRRLRSRGRGLTRPTAMCNSRLVCIPYWMN